MPTTIKTGVMKIKDQNGNYIPVDGLMSETAQEELADIQSAGQAQVAAVQAAGQSQVATIQSAGQTQTTAIQNKGTEILNSLPSDYTEVESNVSEIRSAINGDGTSGSATQITALNFAENATKYTSAGGSYCVNYIAVEKGQKLAFELDNATSNIFNARFAFSDDVPAANVSGTYLAGINVAAHGAGTFDYIALSDGYVGVIYYNDAGRSFTVTVYEGGIEQRLAAAENDLAATTQQITEIQSNVSDAQMEIQDITGNIAPNLSDYELGFIWPSASEWKYESSSKSIRTKQGVSYSLKAGASIGLSSYDGYKIRVGGNANGTYSDSGWIANDYTALKDGIYCIDIAYDPEVTITDVSALVSLLFIHDISSAFATPDDVGAVKEQARRINETGQANLKLYGHFDHYGLDANGNFLLSQKYRVSNTDKIQLERDITVTVKAGFRWGYVYFTNGVATWNGWFTPGTKTVIPAGTQFVIQIARVSENQSEIADVDEFVSAVEFRSYLNDVLKVTTDGAEYIGDMKPQHKYMLNQIATVSSTYDSPDGLAITGNTLAMLFNGGGIALYDLITKTAIGQYMLASAGDGNHANSASFSNVMGTTYPLLYVSECYGSHRCFVEDIGASSSTLVQTISFTNSDGDYTGAYDWILDVAAAKIMTFGISGDNKLIKVFNLPTTEIANVELSENDVLDEWIVDDQIGESFGTYQGNTVCGNILYLPASSPERIYAFDKITHAMIGKINLTADRGSFPEIEGIAVYGDKLIISDNYKKLYQIEFS